MDQMLKEYLKDKKYKQYELDEKYIPELIKLSENKDKNIRLRAVYALGKILTRNQNKLTVNNPNLEDIDRNPNSKIIDVLKKALDDDSGWVIGHAANFLSKIHFPEYKMIELLRDGCPWVRHTVAEAIGEISVHDAAFAEKAIPELIKLLEDRSLHVQSVATESLMRITGSKAITDQKRKEIWKAIELHDPD